uniref:ER membrane protein complex subunit 7 beta-sandwich domain-containing protein n=1 Tax=Tetraselmis chuii TaxID=63592 RepID=A0A7S1SU71_9CHLO|mmetsp:Transcript_29866/g.53478  ORF Transcript_29866/g.53478 Transcript_29866/m.53478 type:complete len:230 (+) Transcript_29866:184-873(+)|eukprot:CAMPEP_0177769744 /NCGR_PEP_ID=MMETSP0491_2-20121128/10517_1 /TAXON_ID=63592 /ORGANISM="Tetraselmis chuii, Strain PLY429" /LENGTH=229 /DNA_ID=CAMNT_0019286837 /DNA_START=180 /DNA_END=869 /DNA_ORIENTATION=-
MALFLSIRSTAGTLRCGVILLCLVACHAAVSDREGGGQVAASAQPVTGVETGSDGGSGSGLFTILGSVNVKLVSPQGTRVSLLLSGGAGTLNTFVRLDGTFTLRDAPPGVHVLEVFHLGFLFPQIRVEVSPGGALFEQQVKASYVAGDDRVLPYPLMVQPMGKVSYFEPRQGFSWRSFLFQPQIIMMLIMVSGLFILPKMALDPEQLKEMQAMQQPASRTQAQGKSRKD